MACSLSTLPVIASTCSTPISAMNGITARWKLGCTALTFFPVGKRLQSNVGLSFLYQRRPNGVVVRADMKPIVEEKSKRKNDADAQKPGMENSPSGVVDSCLAMRTMRQMVDMMERQELSVRTPWDIMENENEVKMRFDMPGLSREDVQVSVVEERVVVIHEREGREKESWSFHSSYNTRLMMPENYDTNKIKSEFKNGVLYMTIPRVQVESKIKDLPENLEMEKIMAEFKNGVLNIKIPKSRVDVPENSEMEKIMAEFKGGVLNITIPKSKVESKVKGLPVN